MSFMARRLALIQPSPTLAMTAKAAQLKAQGVDVISLSAGEPDFDTPIHIKIAAIEAMQKGLTKYTPIEGMPSLIAAIQEKFLKDNNIAYAPDEIMASTGAKQVIFNAFMATLNDGDEVIIPAPYWVSYPDIVNLFGGIPKCIPCGEENNFKLTPAQLESAITPRTKWLILNSPSNPTGEVYSQDELQGLANVLLKYPQIHILCDDIYEYLVYDDVKFYTLLTVCPALKDQTLVVNGVSKSYAMTGWRLGYGAGPKHLVKAMKMLQSQSTSNASSISQAAAVAALNGYQDFLHEWRNSFAQRRQIVWELINQIPGLSCRKPSGAFYLYINCSKLIGQKTPEGQIIETDNQLSTYLLEKGNVAVVSGDAFGLSPYFRISYATSETVLRKGCQFIADAIAQLK